MSTITGTREMRYVARDLKAAGTPGKGLSRRLRREIIAEVGVLKREVQSNALAIPAGMSNPNQPSLRASIAHSIRVSVSPFIRVGAAVRLMADGARMPAGMQSLTAYEEGSDGFRTMRWRHPLFGDKANWFPQASHPYFFPTVLKHQAALAASVMRAVDQTARALAA